MNPRSGSVETSLTVTLSPTSRPLPPLHQLAFHVRIERAHEGSVVVHAGDDGLVALADVRMKRDGRDALLHLALDLACGVFHSACIVARWH